MDSRSLSMRCAAAFAAIAGLLAGCAGDSAGDSRGPAASAAPPAQPMQATAGTPAAAGTSGDFGNATTPPRIGTAGAGAPMHVPQSDCKSGQYRGTYSCDLEVFGIPSTLEGSVSFVLEIDETVMPGECAAEFCPDLVIAAGTGTLFGAAGDTGWAFQGKLDGGLDCASGEFRASIPDGIYGFAESSDPNDPNALVTVVDPPLGAFDGMLSGKHATGTPERITGDWDLSDAGQLARCTGPFMVELQP